MQRVPGRLQAVSHRGYSPPDENWENTAAAFSAAIELGYTTMETDLHATADGVLVAFHDSTLDRVANVRGKIAHFTWQELQQIRVGKSQKIPRFVDLLRKWPQINWHLDIKAPEVAQPLAEIIKKNAWHDRVLVSSFSETRRRRFARKLDTPALAAPGAGRLAAIAIAQFAGPLSSKLFSLARHSVTALSLPHDTPGVFTPRLIQLAHEANMDVYVWTPNKRADINRVIDMGADGIITDEAPLLREIMQARGLWPPPPHLR